MPPVKPKLKVQPKVDHEKKNREKNLKRELLRRTGTPDFLVRIEVKQLWNKSRYRINLYRKLKTGEFSIFDSYFASLTKDDVHFSPDARFKYHDAELGKLHEGLPNRLVQLPKEET